MNSQVFSLSNIISEIKYSVRLAFPLIASEAVYAVNGFVATAMVAHLGKEQLAANILATSIYATVVLFFMGVICSICVMTSQSFGARDNVGVSICFRQGLIMGFAAALPMMVAMWFAPVILVWVKQDPFVIKQTKPLFYSLIWTMLPLNLLVVVEQFLVGINKARLVMILSSSSMLVGVFFYYILMFGKFGFPKFGLAGYGYGLAISYSLMAICGIGYMYFSKEFKVYSLFKKWWVIESKFLYEMIKIGTPMGFMWCSELMFFAAIAFMMGKISTTVLAAYQISYQYLIVALSVLFGLHQCSSVRIGNEVGKNDRSKFTLIILINTGIGVGLVSIFSVFYTIFPHAAMSLDIDFNIAELRGVAIEAARYFPIVGILLVTDCIRLINAGALRGLKDSNLLMIISMLGFWGVAFPCAYLFAFKLGFGGVGVWWGIVVGLFVTGVAFLIRFNRLSKHIDLLSLVTKKV